LPKFPKRILSVFKPQNILSLALCDICSNVCADSAIAARTLQATTAAAAACTCKRGNICSQHVKPGDTPEIQSIWVHRNSKLKFQIELD